MLNIFIFLADLQKHQPNSVQLQFCPMKCDPEFLFSCIGGGNGNPLQCSCPENPRDGGAWWAAVYGSPQSRTRLKRLGSGSASRAHPWRPTRGSLTSPSYLVRKRTLGPPLENNPEIPPSSRDEGLRLLHGLETNLATSLQTPQEA